MTILHRNKTGQMKTENTIISKAGRSEGASKWSTNKRTSPEGRITFIRPADRDGIRGG